MSDVIDKAVAELNAKLDGGFDGTARFVIEDEGAILVDEAGARPAEGDEATEVTLTADAATFREILEGGLDPTAAFMQGRLKVDGDMGTAMKLGQALS